MSSRCLVIGLDGATFDIITPMISMNRLPNISKLIDGGVHGELLSTIPPASIPAWPSLLTGRNPGKHGVYDFLKKTPGEYIGALTNSNDLRASTLYEILSEHDKTSVVINVTGTYPPKKLKGCLISGLLTPKGADYVYPITLKTELDDRGYIVYSDLEGDLDSNKILEIVTRMELKRIETAISLMRVFDWDFFMVMIIGTDTIQHKLWGEKEKIYEFYDAIDKMIGDIMNHISEHTNTIIVSDHGFGPHEKTVNINKWLQDLGLLKIKKIDENSTRASKIKKLQKKKSVVPNENYKINEIIKTIIKIIVRIPGFSIINRIIPTSLKKKYSRLSRENLAIDWLNTKVALSSFFGTETQSIMINLKGREPEGTVKKQDYNQLRKYVMKQLWKIKDPETNDIIIDQVFTREELYNGPFLEEAPDIIMLLKGEYKASNSLMADKVIRKLDKIQGSHRSKGIYIAHGPNIPKGKHIDNMSILDIAPTILELFNLIPPDDMDGRPLSESLTLV